MSLRDEKWKTISALIDKYDAHGDLNQLGMELYQAGRRAGLGEAAKHYQHWHSRPDAVMVQFPAWCRAEAEKGGGG